MTLSTGGTLVLRNTTERIMGDVQTVEEQIAADEKAIAENDKNVKAAKEMIVDLQADTKRREQNIRKNKKRKSVFMRAKTELEVIDVEVE